MSLTPEQESQILTTGKYTPRSAVAARKPARPPTVAEFEDVLPRLIALLRREVRDEMVGPLEARNAALEARIAVLEARPWPEYLGIWRMGETYQPMQMTTDKGSLWICERTTTARPGDGPDSGWRLAAKRGADAGRRK